VLLEQRFIKACPLQEILLFLVVCDEDNLFMK